MTGKIKILTFSTLYPDSVRTRHGIFVETRLRHLVSSGKVESKVVAPVAWFPLKAKIFGQYANNAKVPYSEVRHGVDIIHPRYLLIPKIGMTIAPVLLAISMYAVLRNIKKNGYDFDVIDAHYFYPDGVAATILGKWLNKPVVITARGTDLSLIPQYHIPRKLIQWAANQASGLITVCQALKETLVDLGVEQEKIYALRNGVDLNLFNMPENRDALRKKLGITGKSIISVGHLIERKGHHLIIEALKQCDSVMLYIAGDGEEDKRLKQLTRDLNVEDRVVFLGPLLQTELKDYYSAVDMLILASDREGWANVLLESMACGTPVVATAVWGTPEVVSQPEAGVLIDRTVDSIAQGINRLFDAYPDRKSTRQYAETFSWDLTTKGQEKLFNSILKH